ncbi:MAG: FtsK/SpoIIIE domain-containing protein [Phycisphaerales bacterium]
MTESPETRVQESGVAAGGIEAVSAVIAGTTSTLVRVAEQEKVAEAGCADAIAQAERECSLRIEAIDAEYSKESRTFTARHQLGREQIEKEWSEKIATASAARDRELSDHKRRTQEMIDKANKDYDERQWLADTVAESAERKAEQEWTAAIKQAEQSEAECAKAFEVCNGALKSGGYALLASPPAPSVVPADASVEPVAKDFAVAIARLGAAADELRRRATLVWTRWTLAIIFVPAVAIVTFFVSLLAAKAFPAGIAPPVLVASATVFVVMLGVRLLARARVGPAARALAAVGGEVVNLSARLRRASDEEKLRKSGAASGRKDEEIARARDRFAAARNQVESRQREEYPLLEKGHGDRVADLERHRASQLERLDASASVQVQQFRAAREEKVSAAQSARSVALEAANGALATTRGALAASWREVLERTSSHADRALAARNEAARPWDDGAWSSPPKAEVPPDEVFIGELAVNLEALPRGLPRAAGAGGGSRTNWAMPISLDLRGRGQLLILAPQEGRGAAISVLANTMLRLVTSFPPGKVRMTIVDPVGLGESFAGFMHLADFEPIVVGDRIWTDAKHIEQRLTDLTEHMEHVIQKYLRNQYDSIQDYNRQAGEVAEPLRFLVLADYPANLTEIAMKRLQGIIASGPRCGVYTMIAADPKQKGAFAMLLNELERGAVTLQWKGGELRVKDPAAGEWPLALETPPTGDRLTALLTAVGALLKDSSRVQVPFSTVAPGSNAFWTLSSAEELRVPLGRAGARKLQYMTLGRGMAQHALVAGRTGSGKSTLFHVLITNLAQWYSPDELEFYLIDFKKGVEFRAYATQTLPHARVVAVESEREFGLSVLKRLDAELTRRGQLFRDAGVQDIAGYRREHPGARMPRVLFAVDEFQEFFVEDDRIAQEAALLLDRLVRQGRAFGMHLVLGSQTLGGAFSIARSTIGQMAVRIALQSSEQDSYLIMAEDNTAPRLLTRPGEAIYNDQSGMIEGNSPFQIVWLPDDQREAALAEVSHQAEVRRVKREPMIVFEGNVPAHARANQLLAAAVGGTWPGSLPNVPHFWMGEAISIKDPSAAVFHRRGASNLLIVGQQEEAAAAMELVGCASVLAHARAAGEQAKVFVIDAIQAGDEGAPALRRLAQELGEAGRSGGVHDLATALTEVADELSAREAEPHVARPPVYLFIHGLQRFRELRKGDDFDFSADESKAAKPADLLARIAREGPSLGIHTIAWCDGVNNLERYLSRQTMREFSWRVVFQMSGSDSTHLIDSPVAQSLGRHRAYLYSDETASTEKFRPYQSPPDSWWREVLVGVARNP